MAHLNGHTEKSSLHWRPAWNLVTQRSWIIGIFSYNHVIALILICLKDHNSLSCYLTIMLDLFGDLLTCTNHNHLHWILMWHSTLVDSMLILFQQDKKMYLVVRAQLACMLHLHPMQIPITTTTKVRATCGDTEIRPMSTIALTHCKPTACQSMLRWFARPKKSVLGSTLQDTPKRQ